MALTRYLSRHPNSFDDKNSDLGRKFLCFDIDGKLFRCIKTTNHQWLQELSVRASMTEKRMWERDVRVCDGTCFCWLKCVRVCVRVPCIGKQGLRKASTFTMDGVWERENVRTLRNQRSRRASDFRDLKLQMLDMRTRQFNHWHYESQATTSNRITVSWTQQLSSCSSRGSSVGRAPLKRSLYYEVQLDWCGFKFRPWHKEVGKKS